MYTNAYSMSSSYAIDMNTYRRKGKTNNECEINWPISVKQRQPNGNKIESQPNIYTEYNTS